MVVDATQRLGVVLALTAEAEASADEDRAIAARQVELVQRLRVEVRSEALLLGALAAQRQHVGRDVAAVDVEAGPEIRQEEAPGPAGGVERGLTFLDEPPEVVDLGARVVELGPPLRNEPVVPRLRVRSSV